MSHSLEPDDPVLRPDDDSGDCHAQPETPTGEANKPPTHEASWTEERYPVVDADFVGETLDRVLSDRERIDFEAALVDAIRFEHGDLECYRIPEPAADFVDRTLARVSSQRTADLRLHSEAEEQFQALIENGHVPEPSVDFVDRTLAAVIALRTRRPIARRVFGGSRFSLVASIAAILLCAVVIFWSPDSAVVPQGNAIPITPAAPIAWGSLITESDASPPATRPVLPIEFDHPLKALAVELLEGDR